MLSVGSKFCTNAVLLWEGLNWPFLHVDGYT